MTAMTDMDRLDAIRRRMIEANKAFAETLAAAQQTPAWRAYQDARVAWEATDAAQRHGDASLAVTEVEETLAEAGASHFWSCEVCSCPLFNGNHLDEPIGDEVHVCHAAAYEDETKDCPGRRLGLLP